jgi:hypothetical protein
MPQDHAWITGNKIHNNNKNYFKKYVQSGICAKKPAERGIEQGTVCPTFPLPVGTGILIAAGNRNFIENNSIYDNWRAGAMLFWVPGAIREEYTPDAQYDTSNGNWYKNNRMGFHPSGAIQPNGVDFSWDEQGIGNCWEGNVSSTGAVTNDSEVIQPPTCASGGSISPIGNIKKTALNAPCAEYDRDDNPNPPGCTWFDDPVRPAARQEAPGDAPSNQPSPSESRPANAAPVSPADNLPTTGPTLLPAAAGLLLAGLVLVAYRRRTA